MKKKVLIGLIAILTAGIGTWFLLSSSPRQHMQLETEKISRNSINNVVTATGTVEPITKVDVGTQVSGIIDRIYVDYNSEVTKGQLIAEMDKITLQSELESKQADLASSKTEFEYQEKNYIRSQTLHEKSLISETDYESAVYNYEKAKSAYERNQADFVKVQRNLGYATITSPIDGIVISRAVEEGQTVAAGFSTPTLFTIANDLKKMEVIANVDEADIGQVKEGQRITFKVDAYANDVFEGEVMQVRLEATTTSNVVTYEVVINAPNEELKLKPGLTANVTIYTMERNKVITAPSKAFRFLPDAAALESMGLTLSDQQVETANGQKVVWQRNGQTVEPKVITVGETNGSITEVIDGMQEGEEVITGLSSLTSAIKADTSSKEQSPFMPQPPGGNKNKK